MRPKSGGTIRFSDAAAARVKALIEENRTPDQKLRVFVNGGGCSGFQYGFEFDNNINDDDTVVENGGATLVVDAMSMQYLDGAEVDFLDGLEGSRFVINNPNASSTCGCGASFSI
jgi:iron-sulfur cluster insertion protein